MPQTRAEINEQNLKHINSILPPGVQAHEVTLLSRNSWNNINSKIKKRELEAEEAKKQKQITEAVKECSKNLWKTWPNTVLTGELCRANKLEIRRKRLEAIENQRLQIDLEEAQLQAKLRKEAIEGARIRQYYQTNRVKTFHSALMLTEVLKERDAQCEMNKAKRLRDKNKNEEYYMKWKTDYQKELEAEGKKNEQRLKNNIDCVKFQLKQIEDIKHLRKQRKMEEIKEGQEIKELAAKAKENYDIYNGDVESSKRAIRDMLAQQIDDCRKMREIEQKKLEEEDDEIRMYAAGKRKQTIMRMKKEREIFMRKQDALERVKEAICCDMEKRNAREQELLESAVKEGEAKFNAREQSKREYNEKHLAEVNAHRIATIERHQKEKEEQHEQNIQDHHKKLMGFTKWSEKEANKLLKKREDHTKMIQYWKQQTEHKSELESYANGCHVDQLTENKRLNEIEDQIFDNYSSQITEHCRKGNRNIYPLIKATVKRLEPL